MRSSLQSLNEVADLLRGLDNPAQRRGWPPPRRQATRPAVQVVASSRTTRTLGWMSLAVGAIALGLSCVPLTSRFGVPVGSAGLLLAMTGLSVAGRRTGVGLPIGGAAMSAAGLGAALGRSAVFRLGPAGRSDHRIGLPITLVANSQPARPREPAASPE